MQKALKNAMPHFLHKGINYHFLTWGDEKNPPLILLHGFAQSADSWEGVSCSLSKHRYLMAPDLIGHGRSDKPHNLSVYTMNYICGWLDAFFDHLGFEQIDLCAYSMGGRIALLYAFEFPQRLRTLVLESAGLGSQSLQEAHDIQKRDASIIEKLRTIPLSEFMDEWENLPVFASQKQLAPKLQAALRASRMKNDPQALALITQGSGQHVMPNYLQSMHNLAIPTLYIAGCLDKRYAKIARTLKAQASAHMHTRLLQAGHNTHLETPKVFAHTVNAFLQDFSFAHGASHTNN